MNGDGAQLPLVAIAGRPNVGKSTLYNRLVGGRPALVHDTAGLTRDRRYGEVDYFGRRFRVVDTGGLAPHEAKQAIGAGIHRQARAALEEADAVIFVVDARAGVAPDDLELAKMLRRLDRPVLVAANKVDSASRESLVAEIYRLGLGEVFPVSAAHGRGVDEMLERVCELLGQGEREGEAEAAEGEQEAVRVAIVGKPNAGKSSLLNRLAGAERALVHDQPGTTTDPVDTLFELGGRRYLLIDTAGIRRKARIDEDVEKLSAVLALGQIERSDVAVLVIDASIGASEQDARIAGVIEQKGRAVVLALNKADLLGGVGAEREVRSKLRETLRFVDYAPVGLMSAKRGDGVDQLMDLVDRAGEQHRRRIPTPELNRFFAAVCDTHPPPAYRGRTANIHYLTQGGVRPPTFLLWASRPEAVSPAYRRFLVNQLRGRYGFEGTPIRIVVKAKSPGRRGARRRRRR